MFSESSMKPSNHGKINQKKKKKKKEAKSCTHQHINKINLKRTNVISAKEFEEIKLEDFHQS